MVSSMTSPVEEKSVQARSIPHACKVERPIATAPHKSCEWKPRKETLQWSSARAKATDFDPMWERAFAKWFTIIKMAGPDNCILAPRIPAKAVDSGSLNFALVRKACEELEQRGRPGRAWINHANLNELLVGTFARKSAKTLDMRAGA